MSEEEKVKIINFLQDFGCAKLEQLQILFDKPNYKFKELVSTGFVSRKDNTFVYNKASIDQRMLSALDVLCKYKYKIKNFYKLQPPTYLSFLTTDNELYNVILANKEDEKGLLKLLETNSPLIREANKYILLFEDEECYPEIKCKTDYIYCIYPSLEILSIRKRKRQAK